MNDKIIKGNIEIGYALQPIDQYKSYNKSIYSVHSRDESFTKQDQSKSLILEMRSLSKLVGNKTRIVAVSPNANKFYFDEYNKFRRANTFEKYDFDLYELLALKDGDNGAIVPDHQTDLMGLDLHNDKKNSFVTIVRRNGIDHIKNEMRTSIIASYDSLSGFGRSMNKGGSLFNEKETQNYAIISINSYFKILEEMNISWKEIKFERILINITNKEKYNEIFERIKTYFKLQNFEFMYTPERKKELSSTRIILIPVFQAVNIIGIFIASYAIFTSLTSLTESHAASFGLLRAIGISLRSVKVNLLISSSIALTTGIIYGTLTGIVLSYLIALIDTQWDYNIVLLEIPWGTLAGFMVLGIATLTIFGFGLIQRKIGGDKLVDILRKG